MIGSYLIEGDEGNVEEKGEGNEEEEKEEEKGGGGGERMVRREGQWTD